MAADHRAGIFVLDGHAAVRIPGASQLLECDLCADRTIFRCSDDRDIHCLPDLIDPKEKKRTSDCQVHGGVTIERKVQPIPQRAGELPVHGEGGRTFLFLRENEILLVLWKILYNMYTLH